MDADIQEYLPAKLPLACQGIIYAARPKVVPLNSTCKDLQTLEFNISLPANNIWIGKLLMFVCQ